MLLLVSQLGIGGAERHTVQLANLLAERFDVVLAWLKDDDRLLSLVHRERLKALTCLGVERRLDLRAVRRLAGLIEEHRVDVVLCANAYPLLYAQLARAMNGARARVVEIYHTTLVTAPAARLRLLAYRPLFWLAHHLVFVCESQRRHCLPRALWAPHMSVIHNGVDLGHFRAAGLPGRDDVRARRSFATGDRVVGLCAAFRPEKAHRDLLEAVALARSRGTPWKVLLIGDGPLRGAIEADIERLGLVGDVRITGYLLDVRAEVAACDVIALVSHAVETFSMAALEAMALGRPLLMSRVGGAAEQVEDGVNGLLFPAGDVTALAHSLEVLAEPARREAMGRAARERVERLFAQPTMCQRYAALIESLAGRPQAAQSTAARLDSRG